MPRSAKVIDRKFIYEHRQISSQAVILVNIELDAYRDFYDLQLVRSIIGKCVKVVFEFWGFRELIYVLSVSKSCTLYISYTEETSHDLYNVFFVKENTLSKGKGKKKRRTVGVYKIIDSSEPLGSRSLTCENVFISLA